VRHELRNPLNNIIGYCELLMEVAEDKEDQETMADLVRIQTAGQQLQELITSLLDSAQIDAVPKARSTAEAQDRQLEAAVGASSLPQELTNVTLPAALYDSLKEAVETHSVTEVKNHLDDIEALGAEGQVLAEQLRGLVQKFDMDAIKIILEAVNYE
jgi:signal transduction histidine kinase